MHFPDFSYLQLEYLLKVILRNCDVLLGGGGVAEIANPNLKKYDIQNPSF